MGYKYPDSGYTLPDPAAEVFIYGLVCARTHRIKYVGRSIHPAARLKNLLNPMVYEQTRLAGWIRLLRAGKEILPYQVILENGCSWENAGDREKSWIADLRNIGFELLNSTDGGWGGPRG